MESSEVDPKAERLESFMDMKLRFLLLLLPGSELWKLESVEAY